jgi:hypothetical protein
MNLIENIILWLGIFTIFKQRLKPYRKFWKFSIEKDNQYKP